MTSDIQGLTPASSATGEATREDESRQNQLQSVTKTLIGLTAGSLLLMLFIYGLSLVFLQKHDQVYLIVFVFIAGALGGFVSIQQRLPNIGLMELKALSSSKLSILLMPINGGIFALVLMLMFMSGIVEGALFPEFNHPVIEHHKLAESFSNWMSAAFPKEGPDIARLLFWAFVSGFSERFVPQIIRKTTSKAIKE